LTKNPMKPIIANPTAVAYTVLKNSARRLIEAKRKEERRRVSVCVCSCVCRGGGGGGALALRRHNMRATIAALTFLVGFCALVEQVLRVLGELDQRRNVPGRGEVCAFWYQ
jgi:hypothetical protein